MKLFSWNVNGVRAIEKKGFLDWFSSESPDILCIQETKAKFEQLPDTLQHIDGYFSYWHSAEKLGYSGVATFSKKEPLHVQYGFCLLYTSPSPRDVEESRMPSSA